jgi:hypothetical protein
MTTPNLMPSRGTGLTKVRRERHIALDCGCCDVFVTEKVTALKIDRKPRGIANTALADALRAKGF